MIDSTARQVSSSTALRWVTVVFAIALAVHGADHLRRGMDTISMLVMALGTIQLLLAVATIALVFTGHPRAPLAAFAVGSVSAVGFTVVHLLPDWFGPLSDSFINAPPAARVTGFSWFAAIFEILADLAIAVAGVRARNSWAPTPRPAAGAG
ncbi:hypothetical protein JK358_08365 [Nocardia sp. 2]|uniref:Uncharacterized protein n=1 Tax=Nocardia acididurans TaxID=2802282 RepID=A0ABS1M3P6_9NOCA|nr:hypothetical protein [Nocardia acididurans]MBL1074409.1 hypothetical protein [Nocardia acididurans]